LRSDIGDIAASRTLPSFVMAAGIIGLFARLEELDKRAGRTPSKVLGLGGFTRGSRHRYVAGTAPSSPFLGPSSDGEVRMAEVFLANLAEESRDRIAADAYHRQGGRVDEVCDETHFRTCSSWSARGKKIDKFLCAVSC